MSLFNTIQYSGNTDYQPPKISSSTRRKLESLGIDPALMTSEAQALSLIERRNSEKSFEEYALQNNVQEKSVESIETDSSGLYSAMNYQANNTRYFLGI